MEAHATFEHDQRLSERMRRFVVPGIVLIAAIEAAVILVVVSRTESGLVGIVPAALAILASLMLVLSMRVRIQVDEGLYSLQLWPFPFRSRVPRESITQAYVREVRPLRQYRGWGVRTRRRDVLYSVGGTTAVTVEFHRNGTPCKLSVTTDRSDELLAALSA
ncbi:MAG: hypothetical protein F4117_00610 [Acidimicrobiales bacterium]|nr:hypothetical protein [Acidimicrobiales bacterium]MXX42155.1 hypothetical protein [Acidimicrobiales bacterium]MXY04075.1 hypothetical protein [Acidimicrobiales bacterium]MXZ15217.1 hypothetical protein [Acidimicrobiales bacterium]MYA25422.1 hypothetical protein [Acidimicrobiales bacterium]